MKHGKGYWVIMIPIDLIDVYEGYLYISGMGTADDRSNISNIVIETVNNAEVEFDEEQLETSSVLVVRKINKDYFRKKADWTF